MKKYLLAFLVLLSVSAYADTSLYPSNLEGNYFCNGTEVDTSETYKATMTLTKTGQTYFMRGKSNDGSTYIGTGIYDRTHHHFSLVFFNPKNSKETGIAVAEVKKNNIMTSTWTYLYKTNLARSICTKQINET